MRIGHVKISLGHDITRRNTNDNSRIRLNLHKILILNLNKAQLYLSGSPSNAEKGFAFLMTSQQLLIYFFTILIVEKD